MTDMTEVKEKFPFESFREKQEDVLEAVEKGLQANDYVLLKGPTGTGKSPINMALCRAFDSAYYTTPQKSLQEQLINDFDEYAVNIKGRANYPCIKNEENNCKNAICQRSDTFTCDQQDSCIYRLRKNSAIRSAITITSFAYFMSEGMIPRTGETDGLLPWKRDLLVVDEGHNIQDWAYNYVDMSFSKYNLPPGVQIPKLSDKDEVIEFLKELMGEYETWKASFAKPYDKEEKEQVDDIKSQQRKIARFFEQFEERGEEWVYEVETGKTRKLILEPIDVAGFLERNLWSRGEKVVVSSATIPDPYSFIRRVGLPKDDVAVVSVPMLFPSQNRKIYLDYAGKMTRSCEDETFPKAVNKIAEICSEHEGEKGLIHCHSYERAEKLRQKFKSVDRMVFHGKRNRDEKFEDWLEMDGDEVFCSVGFSEGIDLFDDRCRFQILLKVPFPFLGDPRVSYKVNERNDWKWYNLEAIKTIVQSYGRAVRSKDDYADFYVVDESFKDVRKRYGQYVPDWFEEAIVDGD